jgi:hypothetical protein
LTIYVDTSVLVGALTKEPATDAAQRWLFSQKPGDLALSEWTVAEVSAALSVKLRTGLLRRRDRATALTEFDLLSKRYFRLLEITGADFLRAARLCDRAESGLRAGDALHLAMAIEHAARLATLDRRLAAAAEAAGVLVLRPE